MRSLEGIRFPRRLRNINGSIMIAIPRRLCRELGLTTGNYLSVRYEGQTIVLTRVNLAQDGPMMDRHHRIPPGKHGDWIRKEQQSKEQEPGD